MRICDFREIAQLSDIEPIAPLIAQMASGNPGNYGAGAPAVFHCRSLRFRLSVGRHRRRRTVKYFVAVRR
jgi:hypothetical protein